MKVRDLIAQLVTQDPELDVRLSAFSPVTGMALRPLYAADAPYESDPHPAGQYLELQPDGIEGAGC